MRKLNLMRMCQICGAFKLKKTSTTTTTIQKSKKNTRQKENKHEQKTEGWKVNGKKKTNDK